MSRGSAGWLPAVPGVLLWAVGVAAPLGLLYVAALRAALPVEPVSLKVVVRTYALAAGVAAVSVLAGYVPGRLLGTVRRGEWLLLGVLLAPLLLPKIVLYYAWFLPLSPTTSLGAWLARTHLASAAYGTAATIVMLQWYWPLAALLIAQGWRNMDPDTLDMARLEAGAFQRFWRVQLPPLVRPAGLAFLICFTLSLSEYGTFHLAGVRTIGTDLGVVYDQTHSTEAVALAAWPLIPAAVLAAVALWSQARRWDVSPPHARPEPPRGAAPWAVLLALLGFSLAAPVVMLIGGMSDPSQFGDFIVLNADGLAASGISAIAASAAAIAMAAGALSLRRGGRAAQTIGTVIEVTLLLAMFLPGSVVAAAIVKLQAMLRLPSVWSAGRYDFPYVLSLGLAVRLAGLAVIVLRLVRDSRQEHLDEMAAVDGASRWRAFVGVQWPRVWPAAVGLAGLLTVLALTEIPATMVLLPPGVPSFIGRLLNLMHSVRQQQVIASCLILIGAYALAAAGIAAVVWLARGRRNGALGAAMVLTLAIAGCEHGGPANVNVVRTIGRTGMRTAEFVYPRAIDLAADGSIFVVDKTGRIQRLSPEGKFIGSFQMPKVRDGKPVGMSFGPDGHLYVADTHYYRVMEFDLDGEIIREFGSFGTGDGQFIYPTDVAFAPDGRIYVGEYGGNDRISVFTAEGKFLFAFGSCGIGEGQFSRPAGLVIDPQRKVLYVADACNHRIARYNLDGKLLGYFGSLGTGPGQLRYPYDLALMADGALLVTEYGNNRLQVFSPEGRSMGTFGRGGAAPGELAYPWGAAVDSEGRAYVADAGNNRVQVWQLR